MVTEFKNTNHYKKTNKKASFIAGCIIKFRRMLDEKYTYNFPPFLENILSSKEIKKAEWNVIICCKIVIVYIEG